jgi:flagellar motor protein MotB
VLAIAVAFGVGFLLGGSFFDRTLMDSRALTRELNAVRTQNMQLQQQLTNAELGAQVDATSLESVRKLVTSLQQKLAAKEEELGLYQNLLQENDKEPGLQIGRLVLKSTGEDGAVAYRLIVQQKAANLKQIKVNVVIRIEGLSDGQPFAVGFDTLDAEVDTLPLQATFKYFKVLEGSIRMPAGFQPLTVLVSVWKDGAENTRVERSFDWRLNEV